MAEKLKKKVAPIVLSKIPIKIQDKRRTALTVISVRCTGCIIIFSGIWKIYSSNTITNTIEKFISPYKESLEVMLRFTNDQWILGDSA